MDSKEKDIKNDRLAQIAREREEIFREMRAKALEFDEEIRAQYERRHQELDDEEFSLKEAHEADEDSTSELE